MPRARLFLVVTRSARLHSPGRVQAPFPAPAKVSPVAWSAWAVLCPQGPYARRMPIAAELAWVELFFPTAHLASPLPLAAESAWEAVSTASPARRSTIQTSSALASAGCAISTVSSASSPVSAFRSDHDGRAMLRRVELLHAGWVSAAAGTAACLSHRQGHNDERNRCRKPTVRASS